MLDDERARNIVAASEDGAAEGQSEVVDELTRVIAEVDAALAEQPSGTTIATSRIPDAVCRLDDYLLTRLAEVVLHGDDLAFSVGVTWHPPVPAADATIALLVDMAHERIGDIEVLRALAREERVGARCHPDALARPRPTLRAAGPRQGRRRPRPGRRAAR